MPDPAQLGGAFDPSKPIELTNTLQTTSSVLSTSQSAGIGYATGAGGTVTQITSKATAVTLNRICGTITMQAAALAAGAEVTFTVNNTSVAATDAVLAQHSSGGTDGAYLVMAGLVAAASFTVTVTNASAGSLSEAILIRFFVLKSVNA